MSRSTSGPNSTEPIDYPDVIAPAARAVAVGECDRAIVLGGSGTGEAIVANKIDGIRCVEAADPVTARLGRQHNDANALSMGARIVGPEIARALRGSLPRRRVRGRAARPARGEDRGPGASLTSFGVPARPSPFGVVRCGPVGSLPRGTPGADCAPAQRNIVIPNTTAQPRRTVLPVAALLTLLLLAGFAVPATADASSTMVAACEQRQSAHGAKTSATRKALIPAGTPVRAVSTVDGGSYSASCGIDRFGLEVVQDRRRQRQDRLVALRRQLRLRGHEAVQGGTDVRDAATRRNGLEGCRAHAARSAPTERHSAGRAWRSTRAWSRSRGMRRSPARRSPPFRSRDAPGTWRSGRTSRTTSRAAGIATEPPIAPARSSRCSTAIPGRAARSSTGTARAQPTPPTRSAATATGPTARAARSRSRRPWRRRSATS